MQVWCFEGAEGLWALSDSQQGDHLPQHLGPWRFLKTAELTGQGEDEQEAAALLAEHGYCCFDGAA
jgi:hypothetical protein